MFLSDLPAIEIAGLSVGLREIVLALIVFIAVYIGVVLYRMRRISGAEDAVSPLRHAGLGAEPPEAAKPGALSAAYQPSAEPPVQGDAAGSDSSLAYAEISDSLQDRSGSVEEMPALGRGGEDAAGLANELAQLREEVDALRGALAALREDMQEEFTHLRATQSVSPVYGDAMQLAVAGYDAAMIAERCGVARAEAELVVALARSQVK